MVASSSLDAEGGAVVVAAAVDILLLLFPMMLRLELLLLLLLLPDCWATLLKLNFVDGTKKADDDDAHHFCLI